VEGVGVGDGGTVADAIEYVSGITVLAVEYSCFINVDKI
jgi:hypothetical protein